jgi:histidinol-phosphatase (PHP family)
MIPDYHLHSSFSDDAKTSIYDLIASAKALGMNSICITDHNDKDYPIHPDDDCTFQLDIDRYISEMQKVRDEAAPYFDLRIGVEQGVMPETAASLNDYSILHPGLDFIIASSHIVDNEDPYYPAFYEGRTEKEAYRRYFEAILQNVQVFHDFDVYGHLDYCLRYGPNKAARFDIHDYLDIFEAIFKIIIPQGKGIEVNTGSLYRGLDFPHPHIRTLELYQSMGGEILTLGSDSHDANHIGYGFAETADLLKAHGFRHYCTFRNRKPEFHTL